MEELDGLGTRLPQESGSSELELKSGRPRMEAELVFVLICLRGYFGSLTDRQSVERLRESRSVYAYLQRRGWQLPAITTILENVNMVGPQTLDYILAAQLQMALSEKLEDFTTTIVDSTGVEGNTKWPTDSDVFYRLLERAHRYGQLLDKFGVCNLDVGKWGRAWLKSCRVSVYRISMTAGKAGSKRKREKHYRGLFKAGLKLFSKLVTLWYRADAEQRKLQMPPSTRAMFQSLFHRIHQDLLDAYNVYEYADERIFNGKTRKMADKILSLSDTAVAFIKKGQREGQIGYKPQIARSGEGLITALILPEGNAADSQCLLPLVQRDFETTGVLSPTVSTDDGYSSAKNMDALKFMRIPVVSMSGSVGKKITPKDDWTSEAYKEAGNNRSVVESLMFVLKQIYAFGRMRRRGLEAVRCEMLEKVIAYNFSRISLLRRRKAKRLAA